MAEQGQSLTRAKGGKIHTSFEFVVSIQVLRGIAALLVVLYHHSHYLAAVLPTTAPGRLPFAGGYAGVDIFFIISGFMIVYSTQERSHARPLEFAIRRFFRVVPLAQLATLAYYFSLTSRPPPSVLWRSLFLVPISDVDPPKFGFPVIAQAWALSYELIFYTIFAGVLLFTHRRRVIAASAVVVASVVSCQWALGGPMTVFPNGVYLPNGHGGILPPEALGELGNPILLEFVLGMTLADAYIKYGTWLRDSRRAWVARFSGLALVAVFVLTYLSPENPGNGLLNKGMGAACLVVGALLVEVSLPRPGALAPRRNLLRLGMWLGSISYPLYLVHFAIAERIVRRLCSFFLSWNPEGVVRVFILIAVSLALAAVVQRFVETRFLDLGRLLIRALHRRTRISPSP